MCQMVIRNREGEMLQRQRVMEMVEGLNVKQQSLMLS